LVILIALTAVNISSVSFTGNVTGGFSQSLVDRDSARFLGVVLLAIPVVLGSGMLRALIQWAQDLLSRHWRKKLVMRLHDRYFHGSVFYRLELFHSTIDNPDQRITQDVDKFCILFADILMELINSPVNLVLYTYKTWKYVGWYAPILLFLYFICGYALTKLVMDPISKLIYVQDIHEGDFRYDHMRVRTFSESVAIYNAGSAERRRAEEDFEKVLSVKLKVIHWRLLLGTIVNGFQYWGSVINYIIIAIPILYFPNEEVLNSPFWVGIASFNCMMLMYSFGLLIGLAPRLAELSGLSSRIHHLIRDIDRTEKSEEEDNAPTGTLRDDVIVRLSDVAIHTPQSTTLIKGLNFSVVEGQNTLITGVNGSGKTTILRSIMGLWPFFDGKIEYNSAKKAGYVPQKPFIFKSTLRQLISYPTESVTELSVDTIQSMREIGLGKLLDNYTQDERIDWYNVLSPGEQQSVAFIRLLYHRPHYAFLDECTSSVSEEVEEVLYQMCVKKGITMISIAHRSTVRKFHQQEIRLDGVGGWKIVEKRDVDTNKQ